MLIPRSNFFCNACPNRRSFDGARRFFTRRPLGKKREPKKIQSLKAVPIHHSFSTISTDRSITFGDVTVDSAPPGSNRKDLIPQLNGHQRSTYIPSCQQNHLRWLLQKDLVLNQDFLLLGSPSLARDRRHLIFLYAALVEREVEYIALSRDTSDADLKQRKEVLGDKSVYIDQAPVRAALNGRLLILDGLEKAERNVLPTLNNLLENREMSLDDGGLLVSPSLNMMQNESLLKVARLNMQNIQQVHPDFRVAALTSDPSTLDPPLRSRFQARFVQAVDPGEMLHALLGMSEYSVSSNENVQELVRLTATIPEDISLQSLHDAASYMEQMPNQISAKTAISAYSRSVSRDDEILKPYIAKTSTIDKFIETPTTQSIERLMVAAFDAGKKSVALVGPKGSYKSALARHFAQQHTTHEELFALYSDMTARDLILTRGTDENGSTYWRKTPFTTAIERGSCVILDGIDKIGTDTLTSLSLFMETGQLDLPDGTRLHASKGFKCIALAQQSNVKMNDWQSAEIMSMFHFLDIEAFSSHELNIVLTNLYPSIDAFLLEKLILLRDQLQNEIEKGAVGRHIERDDLVLSLRKMKHICKRLEQKGDKNFSALIESALLTHLMPNHVRELVIDCMKHCGIEVKNISERQNTNVLDVDLIQQHQRLAQNPLLVPSPIFEENVGHTRVLADLLEAHAAGEEALLIMGYQGVGKNRIVDHLLYLLNCEREYLQLHRDTTVQSLMSSPSVENGRIVYGDSPLVRAAKKGRILVLDEADKAPVEVLALLKGLIEDRELALPDGRTLRYNSCSSHQSSATTVIINPDFRIWALANPASYPFHGNDISGEMSDIFSCHTVPALDASSQKRILMRYAQHVSEGTIDKIVDLWDDMRLLHGEGTMTYPFSLREAISVVKHLDRFPTDSLHDAFENVLAFDRLDKNNMRLLSKLFASRGIAIIDYKEDEVDESRDFSGVISTPKTRASTPKHGKIDDNNDPHVGGNTWAGGSGGSDTAGLGGRGGPYRLDSGHPIHQVSEKMKAQVSNEAKEIALQMAREGLEQKLKDLSMGEHDWERYKSLRSQVEAPIEQLRSLLKDIKHRKNERVWLRRQANGELDDSRLVDAIAGEKDVFKKRGMSSKIMNANTSKAYETISVKLLVDISASMYRFNSYDGRLQRLLESTLMIMESFKDDDRFALTIVGHNGDGPEIPLLQSDTSQDEKTQLKVLETMIAHTQYTFAGDHTFDAIEIAVDQAHEDELILIISDANLERYDIEANHMSELLNQRGVHAHLVLVGSIGEEANYLAHNVENGRAQVCFDSQDLPVLLKKIISSFISI